jgi:ribose 5-phosphate isomerase B
MKKIFIGSDHAGFELKEKLKPFLLELGYEVVDKGATALNADDDYPDYIFPVARAVGGVGSEAPNLSVGSETPDRSLASVVSKGIIIGLSGQGEAMAANRIKGVRAVEYYGGNLEIIKLSRQHNDSNILSLGAGFLTENEAKEAISLWLSTVFSGDERHIRRIHKLDMI